MLLCAHWKQKYKERVKLYWKLRRFTMLVYDTSFLLISIVSQMSWLHHVRTRKLLCPHAGGANDGSLTFISFKICWHIECSTFTALSFRIWNSLSWIPSPPLALFIVMLSKAHLTSHFRMSGSRWVITPSCKSWSWRCFLYSSSVYSCHLYLISSASVGYFRAFNLTQIFKFFF